MPKKIGSLIEGLLKKAGFDTSKDELKKIIEISEELPDGAVDALEKSLMTAEAAKSNPDVIKKVKAEIFNGADQKITSIIEELGLEADDDFKNEKNTFEKINRLTKLALDAGMKKSGAGSSKEKTDWAEKEKDYNKQLKELKDNLAAREKEYKETRENDLTSFELQKILGGKNYSFPDEMDAPFKINTALSAVNAELQKKGHCIKRNENGQLVILDKDGNPAYSDRNVALEPNTFIDGVLAQYRLLKVTEEGPAGGSGAGPAGTIIPKGGSGNNAIVSEIGQQMAELGMK